MPRSSRSIGESASYGASALAIGIGIASLLGWLLDVDVLKRIHEGWPSTKPNTALGLVLGGLGLAALAPAQPSRRRLALGRALGFGLCLVATGTLLNMTLGRDVVGLDQLLYVEQPRDFDSAAPGRMAPATALNLLMLGAALLALGGRREASTRVPQGMAVVGGASCLVALLGYLFSTPASHRFMPFSSVALHTAVGLAALWTGVLAVRSRSGLMAELTSRSEGGMLARRLLPAAVGACIALAALGVVGGRAGLYGWEYGAALLIASTAIVIGALVWASAAWLNRVDAARGEAFRQRVLSDERRRRFFEQNPTAACITRLDATIVDCNPAFLRVFGVGSRDELLESPLGELLPVPLPNAESAEILAGELIRGLEITTRRRDGVELSLVVDIGGELDEKGELVGFCHHVKDVTEQRDIESQLLRAQRMEAVGRLAGGIAHDFNNLLGVMLGYSDLLSAELSPASSARELLDQLRASVDRAVGLTRQLLTFSRHQPLEPRACDVNGVVEGMKEMLAHLLGEGVRLTSELDGQVRPVRVDPSQLEQVIMNLALNARDAMPDGGSLTIATHQVQLDEAYVRKHPEAQVGAHLALEVTDTGLGMSPETTAQMFEPFFTTKERGKGTGLGLATVYGIAKRLGGHVTVHSEPTRGTRFSVFLPTLEATEAPPPEATSRTPTERRNGAERILIVEDDPELRRVVARVLRHAGYETLEAADASAALMADALSPNRIDLLLTDMVLPGEGGPAVAARLVARDPELRVLFMSGYADRTLAGERMPAASHFLQKPFSDAALLQQVRGVLDAARSEPEHPTP